MRIIKCLLFVVTVVICASCTRYPSVEIIPHTQLLNLKGEVRKVNYECSIYEVTESGYTYNRKASFDPLLLITEADPYFNFLFSKFNFSSFTYQEFAKINPNELLFLDPEYSFYVKECTNITLTFNREGFVTQFTGVRNDTLIFDNHYSYKNNLIIKDSLYVNHYKYNRQSATVREYGYKDKNIIKSTERTENSLAVCNYTYNDNEEEYQIKLEKSTSYNNSETHHKNYTLYIGMDDHNKISQIEENSSNIFSIYKNGCLTRYSDKDKGILYNYTGNNLTEVIFANKNKNNTGLDYNLTIIYNFNNDIVKVCKDMNDYRTYYFNYKYDNMQNWTQQDIAIDRKFFDQDYYKFKEIEKRAQEKVEMNAGNYYSWSHLMNDLYPEEHREAFNELSYSRVFSEKTVITRDISYY